MIRSIGALTLSVFLLPSVSAATFCATNSTELQAALSTAGSNNEDDVIRLQTGTYSATAATPTTRFSFSPSATDQDDDIQIIGGFTAFFSIPCGQLVLEDASLTVLDGDNSLRVMQISPPETGDVFVRNLTFINGIESANLGGTGLLVLPPSGQQVDGALTIQNNIFLNNSESALRVGRQSTSSSVNVKVLNNVFASNASAASFGRPAATLNVSSGDVPGGLVLTPLPQVVFAHNTIVNNSSSNPGAINGAVGFFGDVRNVRIASNNFWANDIEDLTLSSNSVARISLINNNIENFSAWTPPDVEQSNISVEPHYLSCGVFCFEFVPAPGSPLIDSGFSPSGFFPAWEVPQTDITGDIRVADDGIDIGAYEGRAASLFSDRFESD